MANLPDSDIEKGGKMGDNWKRILVAKLSKELEIEDELTKCKVLNQPQMVNGMVLTSCLSQEGDFREVIIKKLSQHQ